MDHLLRSKAPVTEDGWAAIDEQAREDLKTFLAARKLVDFRGPYGWEKASVNLGRTETIEGPAPDLLAKVRRTMPLVELRAEFTLSRAELDDASRGAPDIDLDPLDDAAKTIALGENVMVFQGHGPAGIRGMSECSPHEPIELGGGFAQYPTAVARAVDALRLAGIEGPYGLAIGPDGYTGIISSTEEGGHLLLSHLRQILGGPVVWAPGVQGAVVLSLRGGDFTLDCGQDFSIGYLEHDATSVKLYLEESFTFQVLEPKASVALRQAR